jgi:hypothetical protein
LKQGKPISGKVVVNHSLPPDPKQIAKPIKKTNGKSNLMPIKRELFKPHYSKIMKPRKRTTKKGS